MPPHLFIRTFGCQMNEHDSDRVRELLALEGYAEASSPEEADLILFNTCTIREKAHQKAMSEIGRSKEFKRARPEVVVAACGCAAQEEGRALFERFPHLDLLVGPDQLHQLPALIEEARAGRRQAALDLNDGSERHRFLPAASEGPAPPAAFVSIMKGCNGACTYCIVPSVRGRESCRPASEIVEEVRTLVRRGSLEVTLLGQNVNSYQSPSRGPRGHGRETFASLLRRIAAQTDIQRVRFTSPHPKDVGEGLVREYAENDKLMPHIHLPVQAGADRVLRRMGRGYTRSRYLEICRALRRARSDISITTDIIVGFCGETREEFEETIDLMERADFDSCFAFKYSPRRGTAAFQFADDVPVEEKEERLSLLLAASRERSRRKNEALVGEICEVLAVGFDVRGRGLLTGRRPDNRIVHFAGQAREIGTRVRLRVAAAHDNSLTGERCELAGREQGA